MAFLLAATGHNCFRARLLEVVLPEVALFCQKTYSAVALFGTFSILRWRFLPNITCNNARNNKSTEQKGVEASSGLFLVSAASGHWSPNAAPAPTATSVVPNLTFSPISQLYGSPSTGVAAANGEKVLAPFKAEFLNL